MALGHMLFMGIVCLAIPVQSFRLPKGLSLEVHGIAEGVPTASLQSSMPSTGALQPRSLAKNDTNAPDTNRTNSVPPCAVS